MYMALSPERRNEIVEEEQVRAKARANIDSVKADQQKKTIRWIVIVFLLGLLCSFLGKLPGLIRDWNAM
jgi:hypothetical protein